ncbi:MAG: sialate O-acetylesterase, partial [Phycisphaeraceae bacterium]
MRIRFNAVLAAALLFAFALVLPAQAAKPLKVYILVGQSNMQGHARVTTIDYIGEDPKTKHLHKLMVGNDGQPVTADRVWVADITGRGDNNGVTTGKLTTGFGARSNPTQTADKIGPEYAFGLVMQEAYDGPILIIKAAWGGKSLHIDYRSPSSGTYVMNQGEIAKATKQGKDVKQLAAEKAEKSGHYYRLMMDHVKTTLADPSKVVPGYDKEAGYEIDGFVWFQGFNDLVFGDVYPNRNEPGGYNDYSKWMGMFIKDVRKDLEQPKMPFVIGVLGVGGPDDPNAKNQSKKHFRQAMALPAKHMDGVFAVDTAVYWDMNLDAIDKKRGKLWSKLAR